MMPTIHFSNGLSYSITSPDLQLHYEETGDRHGNNNIRSHLVFPYVFQALQQIDSALLSSALAAIVNQKNVPLDTMLKQDCTLDVITFRESEGKKIYFRTMALLFIHALYKRDPSLILQSCSISGDSCTLQYTGSMTQLQSNIPDIEAELYQMIQDNKPVFTKTIWQKESLLESFPSLQLPYNSCLLADYDDYECVPVVVHDDFALVSSPDDIYAYYRATITDYHLSASIQDDQALFTIDHL
ncbi:MAG: hypothetical protein ACI3U1_05920 [Peptococcaceae bacterium]